MRSDAITRPSCTTTEKIRVGYYNTLIWFPCSEFPYSNFRNLSHWAHVHLEIS